MALVIKDRVRETTTTTGTGTLTLAGVVAGYQSFSAIGNANTTYYVISSVAGTEWEVGIGTYTLSGTTLSRDTILASSNAGSIVTLSSGIKDVYCAAPAIKSIIDGVTTALPTTIIGSSLTSVGTITSGTWSGSFGAVSGANLTSLTAGNLSGTIPSGVLGNSTQYIGTTAIALNRASASQSLTGINIDGSSGSCTGNAATATTATNVVGTSGRVLYNNGTNITTTSANLIFDGTTLTITGNLNATTKSFVIPHRTQLGKRLVYGVLEGPEHSVYVRGVLNGTDTIQLPEEWIWLVDADTITVQLTPLDRYQKLSAHKSGCTITVLNDNLLSKAIKCDYHVYATRKDVPTLVTVQ